MTFIPAGAAGAIRVGPPLSTKTRIFVTYEDKAFRFIDCVQYRNRYVHPFRKQQQQKSRGGAGRDGRTGRGRHGWYRPVGRPAAKGVVVVAWALLVITR